MMRYIDAYLIAQSFSLSDIEPVQNDVTVLDDILLALLPILSFRLYCVFTSELHEICVFHDFSADKASLKVCMNDSSGLGCLCIFSDGPAPHLIMASCEEIYQIKCDIA